MPRALLATGGFLCAVLWMDLMFDVQAWGQAGTLPAAVLDSIAGYYRRVTTEADPMGSLVSLVMLLTVVGAVVQLAESRLAWWLRAGVLLTVLLPVLTALILVVPAAVRLGAQEDSLELQSLLVYRVLHGHVWCLLSVLAFLLLQGLAVRRLSRQEADHPA
jgi:hypothetical protein